MTKITKPERVFQDVVVQTECDNCGKREPGNSPSGWHHFSRSHGDWGNDSVDSFEYFDVCSAACYIAIVRRELEDYGPRSALNPTLEVDDKGYEFLRDLIDLTSGTENPEQH